ncbi:FAD/NAD(P)-binding protein [Sphingomonas swuensis]|uniref:FAD/NAD(P)-binding protein n=1 Tax=Sphingomonas swuensis TaxID=977800 RepID=A0ABP7SZ67_9SPHN
MDPVAVIGGGFSGVMTAVQLSRQGVPVRLLEQTELAGRGTAYGTRDPNHLLNVPVAKMSAWPDRPDDFRTWLKADGGDFARRMDFGDYLAGVLADHPHVMVERGRVVAMDRVDAGWRLWLEDGRSFAASAAVLALGNELPAAVPGWEQLPMLGNPWSPAAQERLAQAAANDETLLLIGTGLTMIDVMLSLDGAGFAGRAVAVSRRGQLPRAHAAHDPAPVERSELPEVSLMALWQWLRRRSLEVGFRAAVDSLRPHSIALWQGFSQEDRRRFLRHARPWWDVHRHRIAPQVAGRVQAMVAEGRLEVVAGRLQQIAEGEVVIRTRRGSERRLRPSLVVNCTGPLGDPRRSANPLLRALLEQGAVEADELGLGLRTSDRDRAGHRLWAVGPLTKGMYWEMTAVPDIRGQAERIAVDIAKDLELHG